MRLTTVLVVLALAAAGCGGGEENETPGDPREREVVRVLRDALAGVADRDGNRACSYLTARGRSEVESFAGGRDCATAVGAVVARLPSVAFDALRNPVITDVRVDGARASATVEPPGDLKQLAEAGGVTAPLSARVTLVRAGGQWKIDDAVPGGDGGS